MLKFLLGVAIIAFTTFCGYIFAKKYRIKKQFFMQLQEFNERFLSEIAYYKRPLREFIAGYAYRGEFDMLLQDFIMGLENGSFHERTLSDLPNYAFLTQEECRFVSDYFLMLGRGDSASQKGYFSSVKEPLIKLQNKAAETSKKYGDLYVKIGFLCGLLILILII